MKPIDRFAGPRRSILLERLEGRILFDAAPIPLVASSAEAQQPIFPASLSDIGQTGEATNPLAVRAAAGQQGNGTAMESGALETRTLAFPGAAGFGAHAQGGRGGDVYHVTNLLDHGPGSLREAIRSASGPRTIVFDTSGTIHLQSRLIIDQPYLTIAGQTAPGDGITLGNYGTAILDTHDIIVRYVRFRTGDTVAAEHDSLLIWNSHDIMIDHVSASWGVDEIIDTGTSRNVTIQWSMITEALHDSHHVKGPHSMGSIHYGGSVSLHHNLFAHNNARSPLVRQQADVVNNVIYNWGTHGTIAGWPDIGPDPFGPTQVNLQGNYYIAGPSTTAPALAYLRHQSSQLWAADNLLDNNRNGLRDGQPLIAPRSTDDIRFDFPLVQADDALTAYERVLNQAGASLVRDFVDQRIIRDLIEETGQIIHSQNQVGNWPPLESAPAPSDRDLDGIPDQWEQASNHLDPDDPADSKRDVDGDGLTNLEDYLARRASGDFAFPVQGPSEEKEQIHAVLVLVSEPVGRAGQSMSFTLAGSITPESHAEPFEFAIDWTGDGIIDETIAGPIGTQVQHVFEQSGPYNVGVSMRDQTGTELASTIKPILITAVAPSIPDENQPAIPSKAATAHLVQPFGHPQYPPIVASAPLTYTGPQSPRQGSESHPLSESAILSDTLQEPSQRSSAEESGPSQTAEPSRQRPWDRPGYDALWDISYGRALEQTRPMGDVAPGSPAGNANRWWPGAIVAEDADAAQQDGMQVPSAGGILYEFESPWHDESDMETNEPDPKVDPDQVSPSSGRDKTPEAHATADDQPEVNRQPDPHGTESERDDRQGNSDRLRRSPRS